MDFISWNDSLSTGNDEIDRQHKELISNIQKLLEVISNDDAGIEGSKSQREASRLFLFLEGYVSEHFAYEEELMEEHNCHMKDINESEHALFKDRLSRLKKSIIDQGFTKGNIIKVEALLCHWLVHHITSIDVQLSQYVPKNYVKKSFFGRLFSGSLFGKKDTSK